jgi:hypothetical protein
LVLYSRPHLKAARKLDLVCLRLVLHFISLREI